MDDPLVHCPFNMAHTCKRSRFQKHLIKCRAQHPDSKLEPCPYNATEYIHPDDLIEHLKVCTNAKLLEGQKYNSEHLQQHYLNAPFHLPIQHDEPEPEDFEDQEIHVSENDERVLERSVSRMSLKCLDDDDSDAAPSSKGLLPPEIFNRASFNLLSRASSQRSIGRGRALAGTLSVMQQIEKMDYSKYDIRSDFVDKSVIDTSNFIRPHRQGFSLSNPKSTLDESNFEDCSSEEEEEEADGSSVCSSQSTLVENKTQSTVIENNHRGETVAKSGAVPSFVSDSEEDLFSEDDVSLDFSQSSFDTHAPSSGFSTDTMSGDSEYAEYEEQTVLDGRGSSSSHNSISSLINANKMQMEAKIRSMERNSRNSSRNMSQNRGRNQSFKSHKGNYSPAGSHGPSVSANSMRLAQAQADTRRNFQTNQNGYHNSRGQAHAPHRSHSNQSFQSNYSDRNQARSFSDRVAPKGRGSLLKMCSSASGDSRVMNSSGRGNLLRRDGFAGRESNHVGNSVGRGMFSNSRNLAREKSLGNQESLPGRSVGRGIIFNQSESVSRGNHQRLENGDNKFISANRGGAYENRSMRNENSVNQRTVMGRGSRLAVQEHSDGHIKPAGRGAMLRLAALESEDQLRRNTLRPIPDSNVNLENFRGKSSTEISDPSFQAVYNSFKDLQVSEYSPSNSPGRVYDERAQGPIARVPSFGGFKPAPVFAAIEAAQKDTSTEATMPSNSKAKKKKKKKKNNKGKKSKSSKHNLADTSINVSPSPAVTVSSVRILDKSMDPKKYFGDNSTAQMKPAQNNSEVDKASDKIDHGKTFSGEKNASQDEHSTSAKRKEMFKAYDQFYSKMSFCPLNNQVDLADNPQSLSKFGIHKSISQGNKFGSILENERRPHSLQKTHASINFMKVSRLAEADFPSNEYFSSPNTSFAALHQPMKRMVPGRYDKLSETASYKFVYRQINRKQQHGNGKHKPSNFQERNLNDPSNLYLNHFKNLNYRNDYSDYNLEIDPEYHKSFSNFQKQKNALLSSNFDTYESLEQYAPFQEDGAGNEMLLWNKKSYAKINASDRVTPKFSQNSQINWPKSVNAATGKKKNSVVVTKKKFSQFSGSKFSKNQNSDAKKKVPFAQSFLTLNNPFSKPAAYGPLLSSNLNYVS